MSERPSNDSRQSRLLSISVETSRIHRLTPCLPGLGFPRFSMILDIGLPTANTLNSRHALNLLLPFKPQLDACRPTGPARSPQLDIPCKMLRKIRAYWGVRFLFCLSPLFSPWNETMSSVGLLRCPAPGLYPYQPLLTLLVLKHLFTPKQHHFLSS